MRGIPIIDTRVEAAAINDARRDTSTPAVRILHPRNGEWSGQNQLGVELPFQLDANREQTIFKMDEWGFPEVWTISLSLSVPALGTGQAFDIIGEISYGSGGIVQSFEVDWVDGTIFSLPMNAINVRAKWSTLATFFGIEPPEDVRVSCLVSRGGLRHARATKTDTFNETIPAGDFLGGVLPRNHIPAFSKSVNILSGFTGDPDALYNADTFFEFYINETKPPGVNLTLVSIPMNLIGPTTSGKIAIPANARYWGIRNGGAAPITIGASVIWNLFDE